MILHLITNSITIYHLLDWVFLFFHFALILFILFGWIWKRLRIYNLVVIVLTFLSWTVLGIWYGFGYCPFTDWHWQVLWELGHTGLPASYVSYLFQRILNLHLSQTFVDWLTGGLAIVAFIISLILNLRDFLNRRKSFSRSRPVI